MADLFNDWLIAGVRPEADAPDPAEGCLPLRRADQARQEGDDREQGEPPRERGGLVILYRVFQIWGPI